MNLTQPADQVLASLAAATPMAPGGPQAQVSIRRLIHQADKRIYELVGALERETRRENGNTLDLQIKLQAQRQVVAMLKALRDVGFEFASILPERKTA